VAPPGHISLELLNHDVKATLWVGGVPGLRVSFTVSCTAMYVVRSVSHKSWSAASITR
jgi:hypothetical protein